MQKLAEQGNRFVNLNDICTYKSVLNQTDFVGLRYDGEQKKFFIDFPIGYNNESLKDNSISEKEKDKLLRKDILNLLHVLSGSESNNQTSRADFLSKKT